MATRKVNLTEHYHRFVEDQILSGRFKNASEVVQAGLHLLEQQVLEEQERIARLGSLVEEGLAGLDQGEGLKLRGERVVSLFISGLGRRVATEVEDRPRSDL